MVKPSLLREPRVLNPKSTPLGSNRPKEEAMWCFPLMQTPLVWISHHLRGDSRAFSKSTLQRNVLHNEPQSGPTTLPESIRMGRDTRTEPIFHGS